MGRARSSRARAAALAVVGVLFLPSLAPRAATLFQEDFDGYTSFPAFDPFLDPVNPGLPRQSEGADERWYGIRFDTPSSGGSLDADIAVQALGGVTNLTPVGRVEDEAGIVFQISTVGFTNSTLDFDWRTFLASGSDRLRVGYFVGDIPAFAGSDYFDARGTAYAWSSWTPLLAGKGDFFSHASFALPDGVASLWVAFWLDNGEGDYAKIDNVVVEAVAVPEPGALALLGLFGAFLAARRSR
jgi:hypothetical protein